MWSMNFVQLQTDMYQDYMMIEYHLDNNYLRYMECKQKLKQVNNFLVYIQQKLKSLVSNMTQLDMVNKY